MLPKTNSQTRQSLKAVFPLSMSGQTLHISKSAELLIGYTLIHGLRALIAICWCVSPPFVVHENSKLPCWIPSAQIAAGAQNFGAAAAAAAVADGFDSEFDCLAYESFVLQTPLQTDCDAPAAS